METYKHLIIVAFAMLFLQPSISYSQTINDDTAKQMLADLELLKADYNQRKADYEEAKSSLPPVIQKRRQQELDELYSKLQEQEAAIQKIAGKSSTTAKNDSQDVLDKLKAIEEGRFLPDNDFIQNNIQILNISNTYPRRTSYLDSRIYSLCKEDVFAFTERYNMDNLDKAIYMKSDDYIADYNKLIEEKGKIYAYMFDLDNDEYKNNKMFWVDFDVNGITFRCFNIKNETNLVGYAHIGIYQIAFPVQPGVTDNGYNYFFSCDDLSTLKKVKDNLGHITFVILFRPAFAKEVQDNYGSYTKEVAFVNPVAMYILDKNSGEVVMDLSQYIREIASEQGFKSEIALIENVNKKKKEQYANWERDYKERQAKKKYHSTPKQERCFICGGRGEVTINGFVGEGPTRRCTNCYGKGYTLEHYY